MKTLGKKTGFTFSGIHIGRVIILRLIRNLLITVIPAKAGIYSSHKYWIPVFTGMTKCILFRSLILAFILLISTSALCTANGKDDDDKDMHGGKHKKMTICHKTKSGTHRYKTITINKSAWKKHRAHGDTKGPCDDDDEKCTLNITVIPQNVNLGNFFTGTTSDLPSSSGSGNMLEFILRGGKEQSYDFDFDMELKYQMGPGKAEITRWTLEKADRSTRGRYGPASHKRMGGYDDVKLCMPGGMPKCGAFAKFRMTVQQLRITSNATPGSIKFTITIRATANI